MSRRPGRAAGVYVESGAGADRQARGGETGEDKPGKLKHEIVTRLKEVKKEAK